MWGEEGFTINLQGTLSLSCRWLDEDVAMSEPDQKGRETNIST